MVAGLLMSAGLMVAPLTGASEAAGLAALADRAFAACEFTRAALLYDNVRFADPAREFDAELMLRTGQCYFYLNRYADARASFEAALRAETTKRQAAAALLWLGKTYFVAKLSDDANRAFARVLDYDRWPPLEFLYYYGLSLYQAGRDLDAANLIQNLREQNRGAYSNQELDFLLGLFYTRIGDFHAARFYLQDIADSAANRWFGRHVPYLIAYGYYVSGDDSAAARTLVNSSADLDARGRALLGTVYVRMGCYAEALDALTGAAADSLAPFPDDALFREGFAAFKLGRYAEASRLLEGLVERFPDAVVGDRALALQGLALSRSGRQPAAADAFRQMLFSYPQSPFREEVVFNLAQVYYEQGDYTAAQFEYRNYLNLFPEGGDRPLALYRLAVSLRNTGKGPEGIPYLEALAREAHMTETADRAHYLMGQILLDAGAYGKARAAFARVLGTVLAQRAQMGTGDAFLAEKKYRRAVDVYRRVAENAIDSDLVDDARFQIEIARLGLGEHRTQHDAWRAFIDRYPESARAARLRFDLGMALYQRRDFRQAEVELHRLVDQQPAAANVAEAWELIGKVRIGLGDSLGGLAAFERVARDYPASPIRPRVLDELARTSAALGRFDEAIGAYGQVAAGFPHSEYAPKALLELGRIYRALGRQVEARMVLTRILDRYPGSGFVTEGYLELARAFRDEGNLVRAQATLDELRRKRGNSGHILWEEAELARRAGRHLQASELFEKAADALKPDNDRAAAALLEAGRSRLDAGQTDSARTLFERADLTAEDERLKVEAKRRLAALAQ